MKLNFQNILEIMSSLIRYINFVMANFTFQVDFKQSKKCFYFHLKSHFLLNEKLPGQIMLITRYQFLLQTTGKMNYLLRKCRIFIKDLSEKLMKEIKI